MPRKGAVHHITALAIAALIASATSALAQEEYVQTAAAPAQCDAEPLTPQSAAAYFELVDVDGLATGSVAAIGRPHGH